ncbi:hypothetical protein HG530_002660 [Fusarium avenaceum]|nr:hypothetical protein HG530_002660 [Fusarium avenaceum]
MLFLSSLIYSTRLAFSFLGTPDLAALLRNDGHFVDIARPIADNGNTLTLLPQLPTNHGEAADALDAVILYQVVYAVFEAFLGWCSQPGGDHTASAFGGMDGVALIFDISLAVVCEYRHEPIFADSHPSSFFCTLKVP